MNPRLFIHEITSSSRYNQYPRPAKEEEREDAWGMQVRVQATGLPTWIHKMESW
jgi:hypothetical protein